MSEPSHGERVYVEFVEGKFGKQLPMVDSFVYYPKDRDRVRFACKTKGCNATICLHVDDHGKFLRSEIRNTIIRITHMRLPNHPHSKNLSKHEGQTQQVHPDESGGIIGSQRNKDGKERSIDQRLPRRAGNNGPQQRIAADIVLTPPLVGNGTFISGDKSDIVLACEFGIELLSWAERICIG